MPHLTPRRSREGPYTPPRGAGRAHIPHLEEQGCLKDYPRRSRDASKTTLGGAGGPNNPPRRSRRTY